MTKLKTNFCGVEFKNPVITSSGTFGFGLEYNKIIDVSKLGGICVKGLTLNPRVGNPAPRVWETASGMLNSVGLQNPGMDMFLKIILPNIKKFDTRIIANISGNTAEEYSQMAEMLADSGCDIIEMNLSCPNVRHGGKVFGTDEKTVYEMTSEVKKHSKIPLVVKLSPNVTDIALIAKACEDGGADGISLVNTVLGMAIDIKTRKPVFKNNVAGLSGPCIKPIALRMVWQAARAVKIPIIGMGGIADTNDAVEFMLAGANLVSVGTHNFVNPHATIEIINGLNEYMEKQSENNISDIVGTLLTY